MSKINASSPVSSRLTSVSASAPAALHPDQVPPRRGHAAWAHMMRLFRRFVRTRSSMFGTFFTPILMIIFQWALFGDLIAKVQGLNNVDLLPLVVMMILGSQWLYIPANSAEIVRERQSGIVARTSTSASGFGPLVAGEWMFSCGRTILASFPSLIVSFAFGMRIHTWSAAGWLVVAILAGAIFTATLVLALGFGVSSPDGTMIVAPIFMVSLFLSAGFVPATAFVSGLQWFARNNPVTHIIEAEIALNGGALADNLSLNDASEAIAMSAVWFVGVMVVSSVLAVWTTTRHCRNMT
ncbi:ABC transporter permease [Corynebacterium kroppenstedtii]|uniref:ABC transporter permease n=1 Tax=Corynebacterium sp. PCR 32 TaxID=3351342 RepID=UPI0030B23741